MSRYSEKLFRLQYGYHELKGDEIRAPYLEDHYKNVDCVSDLSVAERTAWHARCPCPCRFRTRDAAP